MQAVWRFNKCIDEISQTEAVPALVSILQKETDGRGWDRASAEFYSNRKSACAPFYYPSDNCTAGPDGTGTGPGARRRLLARRDRAAAGNSTSTSAAGGSAASANATTAASSNSTSSGSGDCPLAYFYA